MQIQQKLSVLFLAYSLQGGGTERMVVRLANNYVQRGYEVLIGLFDLDDFAYEIDARIQIVDFSTKASNRLLRAYDHAYKIKKFMAMHSVDVVYAFSIYMVPYAIFGKKSGVKVIGSERANPKMRKRKYKMIISFATPLCDGYIFQTQGAKSTYPTRIQKKSAVIGNIAPRVLIEKSEKEEKSVCSVGRLHNDKDFPTLLRSFKKVINVIPDAHLYIYGDGPLRDELIDLTEELKIADNVVWKGFSQNVLDEIQKYEVFIFSSKAEGMPNSLIEAMAAGMPCVSTNCEFGPSDLIQHGINGFLTPVGGDEQMAEYIIQLLSDKTMREAMGKAAAGKMKEYSEEVIVGSYLDYTFDVLKR